MNNESEIMPMAVAPTLDMRSGRSGENSFATSGGLIPEIVERKSSSGNREEVMTLAIRGRGDDCNLEIRQDGVANAILTPNGGRGGIGVGAIAFDEAQITSKANRTKAAPDLPASTISKDSRMMVAEVSPALKGEGFDASEDGTGRGTPLIPEVCGTLSDGAHMGGGRTVKTLTPEESLRCVAPAVSSKWSKGTGGPAGDEVQNLIAVNRIAARQGGFFNEEPIAFSSKDHGADAGEVCPTIRASGHGESHANAGSPTAIAFPARMSSTQRVKSENVSSAIGAANPTGVAHQENGDSQEACPTMAVRRLTPRECERLQGFPDDFTLVKVRGKLACDGPRYKAIGNSMAVPNIEWIGRRIDLVEAILKEAMAVTKTL